MRAHISALLTSILLAGCANMASRTDTVEPVSAAAIEETGWRATIRPDDEARLAELDRIWSDALALAEKHKAASLEKEAPFTQADGALDHPALPPGSYRCRVIRLGAYANRRGFESFPPFFCYVKSDGPEHLSFLKQTGTDLPAGWLYHDEDANRLVFLGAQQDAPGENSLGYGAQPDRDIAGVVERVGPFQWRLVVPHSDPDGLDIYALTPVPAADQPD
ncbi:DUF4893 domain-containing protein [Stakelama saccharophila]|uniref:DUF4893 domain-containing protein n=1 Tax=Stakelama saccharophila TaxID=3075605 RepID=A0ABZ0B6S5_9SPHN|nr:DUF4893 domain-containing protein [Stakelama sp. W311]WNO52331.1 DUF4893 domain-containing protein [Stakelama sp. W311]